MLTKIKTGSREEWLELRRKYIGGSDAGTVMGMNPYSGPYTLWLEKTGRQAGFEGNITTECGTYLEPFVAALFERETGKKVRRDNHTMVNSDYPWACADVDRRIVGEDALLECKTTTSMPNIKKFAAGEYPETWYCQMTHYLAVTGCKRIYLAVLISCREFKVFTLDRDETEIAALMEVERAFYEHIVNDTPPATAAPDEDTINDLFRDSAAYGEDTPMDLAGDISLLEAYEAAVSAAKEAADARDALKTQICAIMGEYTYGRADNFRVKWVPVTQNRFDAKAFTKAHPEVDLKPYYKESTSRRFDFARMK